MIDSAKRNFKRDAFIIAGLILLALAARSATFFHSVVDWDESNYALMARDIVHGIPPYVRTWDDRPPGLFYILAAAFWGFGDATVALRAAAVLAVAAGAYAVYRLGLLFDGPAVFAISAAAMYIALTSIGGGLATNAELFIVPFVCAAIFVVLGGSGRLPLSSAAWLGVWLSCALQIKETALPEIALVLVLGTLLRGVGATGWFAIAGIVVAPIAVETVAYAAAGHVNAFLDANVGSTLRRLEAPSVPQFAGTSRLAHPLTLLLPGVILAALSPALVWLREPARSHTRTLVAALLLWWAVDLVTIAALREFAGHQYVAVAAPVSLLAAYTLWRLTTIFRTSAAWAAIGAAAVVLGYAAPQVVGTMQTAYHRNALHEANWGDATAQLGDVLRKQMGGDASLFVMHEQPMLYLLTSAQTPSRYAFPPFFEFPFQERVAGINGAAEVRRIRASRPHFIVTSVWVYDVDSSTLVAELADLSSSYRLSYAANGVMILRRRDLAR
jgi:hypothetical protein